MIRCGRLQAKPIKSLTGNRRFWLISQEEVKRLEQKAEAVNDARRGKR
jgi:hypothetical protein